MTTCATEGHEKIPAVATVLNDQRKQVPVCEACERALYERSRLVTVVEKLMKP